MSTASWWELLGRAAGMITLLVGVATVLSWTSKSAYWRRTLWQLVVLSALVLMAGEGTGGGRALIGWTKSVGPSAPRKSIAVSFSSVPSVTPPARSQAIESAERFAEPTPGLRPPQSRAWWPAMIWLGGLGLVLTGRAITGFVSLAIRRKMRRVSDAAVLERVQMLARQLGIRRRLRVLESSRLAGPIAFGVLGPAIGLPDKFSAEFTTAQQEAMLAHELAHLAAGDPLWHRLADAVVAMLWWHPLAWWARWELRVASEVAADEASLMLDDGPSALAESLVVLGRRMGEGALPGGLGAEGTGFRSGLGRRVERLLRMSGERWQSIRRGRAWLIKATGLLALVAAGLASVAWTQPRDTQASGWTTTWRQSLAGLALAALHQPTDSGQLAERKYLGSNLLREGEPKDRVLEVSQAPAAPITRSPVPVPNPYARTNGLPVSPARANVYAKLQRIRFDSVQYDGVPLGEVVKQLSEEARKRDPDGTGVNFIITANQGPAEPEPGPSVTTAREPLDLGGTAIKLIPPLRGISLLELLDAIVRVADKPIKYSVEDYAVIFSPLRIEPQPLYTRSFKVDPNTILQGLQRMMGKKPTESTNTSPSTSLLPLTREFLAGTGVDLSVPKNLFFNDRLGMLMVRATMQDLDTIEKALQVLNMSPPQVTIEAKLCEVTSGDGTAQTLEDLYRGVLTNHWRKARQADSTNASLATATGILTEPEFRTVLRALERRSGVDILTAPKITTLSGRQAQIKVVDVRSVVTDLNVQRVTNQVKNAAGPEISSSLQPITTPFELGPVLDVVPYVAADGHTVQMTIIATIKEFLGYDQKDGFIAAVRKGNATKEEAPTPLPRFRVRQVCSTATVWDGQTIVLFGGSMTDEVQTKDKVPVLGDLPVAGRLFKSEKTVTRKKNLLVFVTPTLIDPAGNRIHAAEEMSFKTNSIPPQPPSPAR